MTDTPVNLNQVRNAKARIAKKAEADANTVKFGRSKIRKAQDKAETSNARRDLDRHRLSED